MTSCVPVFDADEPSPDVPRATEVFADALEPLGAWGREDLDRMADAWEATKGVPLWRDSYESFADFRVRAATFAPKIEERTYFIPLNEARERLAHLRSAESLGPQQKQEVNDLERLLGDAPTDFQRPTKAAVSEAEATKQRYLYIQAEDTANKETGKRERRQWKDRLALVEKEENTGALNLVATQDENEKVRAAALKRLGRLAVTGR